MSDRPVSRTTVSFSQQTETNQPQGNVRDVAKSKTLEPEASRNITAVDTMEAKVESVQGVRAPDPTEIEGLASELAQERRKSLHLAARVEALVEDKKSSDNEIKKLDNERSRGWEALNKLVARVEALETANAVKRLAFEIDAELSQKSEGSTAVAEKVRTLSR